MNIFRNLLINDEENIILLYNKKENFLMKLLNE